jgi:glycosyltransferase involved in cell wall biosynthesis
MAISKKIPVIVWFYPHLKFWMGGTKFIYEILLKLTNTHKTIIVCNDGDKEVVQRFSENQIRTHPIISINSNSNFYWILFPIIFPIELIKAAKIFKSSDVNVATLFPSNLLCATLGKLYSKPYNYYCFEPFPFLQNRDFIKSFPRVKRTLLTLLSLIYSPLDIWATKQAAKVLTLNQITQKMIKNTYGVDSIFTLMGVDSVHFSPKDEKSIQKKYPNRTLITHSTDYTSMKRTDLAIKAIAKVAKFDSKVLLLITSTQPNSPEKAKYQALVKRLEIEKNIEFIGLVSYEDLPKYYSASLCYLSCSYDEMLGTTSSNLPVKEALACGTPAIRANITTEDVEDGISGYLVDPRNIDEVAKKILYLIKRPDLAKKMGLEGRKKIKKLYKWDKVVDSIIKNIN